MKISVPHNLYMCSLWVNGPYFLPAGCTLHTLITHVIDALIYVDMIFLFLIIVKVSNFISYKTLFLGRPSIQWTVFRGRAAYLWMLISQFFPVFGSLLSLHKDFLWTKFGFISGLQCSTLLDNIRIKELWQQQDRAHEKRLLKGKHFFFSILVWQLWMFLISSLWKF